MSGHPLRDGLSSQAMEPQASPPKASIPDAVFNYTPEQHYNIHLGLHPDCGLEKVCLACGSTEEVGGGVCGGYLEGLPLELFEEASCSARNANVKSIGQFTNWKVHSRHAQAFDKAARALFAKAIEAGTVETERLDAKHESAGPKGFAQGGQP